MRAFRVLFLLGVASMATGATAPMLAAEDAVPRGAGAKQPLANAAVTIEDFRFRPASVTVSAGDRVTWTNRDTAQHDATATGSGTPEFTTGLLAKGESASVTFDDAGSFDYVCTVHPEMKAGKVVVRAADGSGGGSGSGSDGGSAGGGGGAGAASGSGSSGTTAVDGGSSGGSGATDAAGSGGVGGAGGDSATKASKGSGGSLPYSGDESLVLFAFGAVLLAAGLLSRALHEHAIWR